MHHENDKAWANNPLARQRTEHLQTEMKKLGLAGLLCSIPENVQFIANVRVLAAKIFVPVEGFPVLLVRPRDIGYVQKEYPFVRLSTVSDSQSIRSPSGIKFSLRLLEELLTQYGLSRDEIGFDELDMNATRALIAEGILPQDGRPALDAARSVKTDDEVDIYRSMVRNYVFVMDAVRQSLRPGVTEHELAAAAAMAWFKLGGEDIEDLEICAGDRMNPWHRWPTSRIIHAAELVGVDFHGRGRSGLIADLSRTFYVGRTPAKAIHDLYNRARDYLLETVDTLRAGRSLGDILAAAPKVPVEFAEQLYNYNIVHSVGMTFGGFPEINKATTRLDRILEPNHVVTVESYFGEVRSPLAVKLERMLVIREGAPEILDREVPLGDWCVG